MSELYITRRVRVKTDKLYGPVHCSNDGNTTMCGEDINAKWGIQDRKHVEKIYEVTCKKCLKKLNAYYPNFGIAVGRDIDYVKKLEELFEFVSGADEEISTADLLKELKESGIDVSKMVSGIKDRIQAKRNMQQEDRSEPPPPSDYKQRLQEAIDGAEVSVFISDESGPRLWVVSLSDAYWLGGFDTKQEAMEFCNFHGIQNVVRGDDDYRRNTAPLKPEPPEIRVVRDSLI